MQYEHEIAAVECRPKICDHESKRIETTKCVLHVAMAVPFA